MVKEESNNASIVRMAGGNVVEEKTGDELLPLS
jgi:hypothetical protein